MYEISWIRLLSMILGSATRSFEVMLSAFVFGLALGGLWVRKRMDTYKRPILVLALVQVSMGLAAFTAAQIPHIEDRRYPPVLSGALYPDGIPIHACPSRFW